MSSNSNYRQSARQIRVSYPTSDFLSKRLKGQANNNQTKRQGYKMLELAKKTERLTTEDDIKILNSFMSST